MTRPAVLLDGVDLRRAAVVAVASGASVEIATASLDKVARTAGYLDQQVRRGRSIYGVTTGFGRNADMRLEGEEAARELQRKLVLTHAVNVGAPLDRRVVRALMVLRLNTLLQGISGIRVTTLQFLQEMLNRGVHPVIPAIGSVGASGDLSPLAHLAVAMLGQGEVEWQGEHVTASAGLAAAGLQPIALSYKEGLALINGTGLMAALGVLAVARFEALIELASVAAALSMEALAARGDALDENAMRVRRHAGQSREAEVLRRLLAGSTLIDLDSRMVPSIGGGWVGEGDGVVGGKPGRPQDSYSLRCVPQVHGAVRASVEHVAAVLDQEINAVTDNPLFFPDEDRIVSAGNFHGMPVALALSYAKVSVAPLASISERRINKLLDAATSDGLPGFLCRSARGTNSGLMVVQYTAAALVNEIATRSMPATAFSIPTCANTEDHVSMGANEGRHLYELLDHLEEVLSLELLTAAQALDVRLRILSGQWWPVPAAGTAAAAQHARMLAGKFAPAPTMQRIHALIRARVPFLDDDRELQPDLRAMRQLVQSGALQELASAG